MRTPWKIIVGFAFLGAVHAAEGDRVLRPFPLDQPGEHVFNFRQVRSGEMTLLLEVDGHNHGERDREALARLRLTIEATLINHRGRTVCHAAGSPTDHMSDDNWVVRMGGGESAFWHRSCAEIKLKGSEAYTLIVRVRDVDQKTPPIKATPIFERSDNYLP